MDNRNKHLTLTVLTVLFCLFVTGPLNAFVADPGDWPRELQLNGEKVIVYQPQPDALVGNRLKARAAVSVEIQAEEAPVFGAVWLEGQLERIERSRDGIVTSLVVVNVRFPGLEDEDGQKLRALLEREVPHWTMRFNMEHLEASLDLEKQRDATSQKISTDPPEILFVDKPSVLVVIDGEPRLKQIENSNLMRVVNTPFTLLFSPVVKRYFLYADKDTWYASQNMFDGWRVTNQVPGEVAAMAPKEVIDRQEKQRDKETARKGSPPEIVISTEPAELISSDGEPEYTPIKGTDLLYMSNTSSNVLVHIMDRQYYVLLAGRWFSSSSLKGQWTYVAGHALPEDFARIPEGSRMASVLYAVPGTQASKEAVLDAYIPTTAAVDPNTASLRVEYDGRPKFEQIRGTRLYYAVNTATPVIQVGKWYYACDQGIWFVAPSPKGPWQVATAIPDSIYLIPPDSPVYNVTFVRVYNAGPDAVYVGYTPGYTHTYVYGGTIVYGTGYYWPGWYGRHYYPRPSTWGYDVHWSPWYGWGYGISYSTGSFSFSIGFGDWYRGSWWGPYYWWDDYPYYYDGYWDRPYYGHRSRYWRDRYYGHRNLYWSKRNRTRVFEIPEAPGTRQGRSKGISRPSPERKYYKDRPSAEPRRKYPERSGPDPKWLQPGAGKPSEKRMPPKEKYNRNREPQQVDPRPPRSDYNQGRPGPGRVPDFHGTVSPGGKQNGPSGQEINPNPSGRDYNQSRSGPNRAPDFHGTVGPRGNQNEPAGRDRDDNRRFR